ncbi:MAG TPA: ATP-binding protein [Candidatus Acidoferrales bacterium]|nr:ATP-binding protein [Candidatus Acidoferrales bacterium]
MAFVSNPGFLAAAFIECSAAFILLVLYVLLAPGFPARFFRYWLAGWTLYVFVAALRISHLWNGGPDVPLFRSGVSLVTAAVFFTAILECCGLGRRLKYLWPFALIAAITVFLLAKRSSDMAIWAESLLESSLFIVAGLILWRSQLRHRGVGWKLLAGSLLLYGLHGLDSPDWSFQALALFRVSLQDLLGITMGISMAVLVLESGRARIEDLNEKLRSLALITAQATQSLRVHESLDGVLRHLVASLNASHGLVFLLDADGDLALLVLRASVGFDERAVRQYARIAKTEPWARDAFEKSAPFVSYERPSETRPPDWLDKERLSAAVVVRIPGKEKPLGLLCIASSAARTFERDEIDFLTNVGNLLGLTVQNVALIESAATARRQWLDTFNSIDDLILVHSPNGRILRANRSLAWHLGLEPDLVQGHLLRELLKHGEIRWSACPYCEGAAGKPEQVDPSFGGHFLVTNSNFHDSEGNCLGTVHVLKDFTERREAETKFRALFEKVQEGIFISTPDGKFIDFNDAFMHMLGYENREELLQIDIPSKIYMDSADRQRLKRLLHEYGEVTDFEFRFCRRDGETRTAHESSFVTRDDSGAIVAYQGFVLDVTERKQAEFEIRRRNRELLALNVIAELLSQSSTLEDVLTRALAKIAELFAADIATVYFLDEPSRTLKRAANFGNRSEYARRLAPVQISASLLQQVRQARATLLSGAALALPEEFRELQRREGILASQVVVLWAKDRIIGTLVIACREMREFSAAELNLLAAVGNQIATTIDKSRLLEETREAYDTLRRTQEQLLQSEKMAAVGQLISGVAHELNNPLTAILGYSQLLKSEESANARSSDYLEKLYKQAQRTHHIVQNLLSFARQHKPERAPIQINQILEDTLSLREYDMKLHSIRIHRELDPNLPAIGGDSNQLQQVFLNILNNAVDAVAEKHGKGEIWLRTLLVEDKLVIEFADNGPGVQNPHRVFDPFYTTKAVGKGTGLGLSICYGIVKEHGGEIQVRNAEEGGAVFSITLPLAPFAPEPKPEKSSRSRRAAASGKVLLVDDDDAVLQLEQEILVARGISVITAKSPGEAINILKRDTIDATVIDIRTPGEVSVADLCAWIERNRPELARRIIFTVWNAPDPELSEALGQSGCPVVRKPFEIEAFWKQVQSVLAAEVHGALKR